MKKITLFIIFLVVLITAFWVYKLDIFKSKSKSKTETKVELSCDDDSTMTAKYYAPDKEGIMTRLTLSVTDSEVKSDYDMIPAMSASGAKYETSDQVYSFWEHQGEFTFRMNDNIIAVCKEKVGVSATMTESEAKAIAEKVCLKEGEELTSKGDYNPNSKTWWFDAKLNNTNPGCNPACVISEETNTAEINWRCTGLLSE